MAQLPSIDYKSTSYKTGYLVLQNNDTLKGLFKQTATLNFKYKLFDGAETKKYENEDVIAYLQYSDRSLFVKFNNSFQKLVVDGPVELYLRIENIYAGTGMGGAATYYYSILRQNEDDLTLLRVSGFTGVDDFVTTATEYFNDYAQLVNDIQDGKYNKHKKTEDLVIRYNKWYSSQKAN